MDIYRISPDELRANAKIPLRTVESEAACYEEMAEIMASIIEKANGKQVVMIVPVGPIGHYPIFAEKVNSRRGQKKEGKCLSDQDSRRKFGDSPDSRFHIQPRCS